MIVVTVAWIGLVLCGGAGAAVYSEAGDTVVPLWVQAPGLAAQSVALADLGLREGDDVDVVSLGLDPLPGETNPMGQRLDVFAVAPATAGQPGNALAAQATTPGVAVDRDEVPACPEAEGDYGQLLELSDTYAADNTPPANDDFADAEVLTDASGQVTGSNTAATSETDEPNHAGEPGGASLWWMWTADGDAPVVFDTKGSSFDTLLAVYTGSGVTNLAEVAANDADATDSGTSELAFFPKIGTTYYIVVDGYNDARGAVVLNWETTTPLANDDFAGSTEIVSVPAQISAANRPATHETGEPNHADEPGGVSVWWQWTPSVDGLATINTHGSAFDTLLAVYTGSAVDVLSEVASNDDGGTAGDFTSELQFEAQAGTTYYIAVDGLDGRMGKIALHVSPPVPKPANDDFVDAAPFGTIPGQVTGNNTDATAETGERNHADVTGGASLWWSLTLEQSALLVVDTHGSTFDTLLAVYTGSSVDTLTEIAANDDDGDPTTTSGLTFETQAGTTYYIVVDGYDGATGDLVLNIGTETLIAFEVQTDPVTVFEGETADVFVRLTATPSGTLRADLSWTDGDTDLGVAELRGASLTFNDGNWDQWQAINLAAAEDDSDGDDGNAEFTVTQTDGDGPLSDLTFTATERDDDVRVTLAVDGTGTTEPTETVWVDTNDAAGLSIEALPSQDWSFANWTLDSESTAVLGDANARVTTVTPTDDVTVTAHLVHSLTVAGQTPDTSATVVEGSMHDFVATAAGGVKPYSYAWRFDGVIIESEDTDTYTYSPNHDVVPHTEESTAGTLVCTVTDSTGRRAAVDAIWSITVDDVDRDAPAPIVEITPGAPVTGDDLAAVVTEQDEDPDGDEIIGYHYEWTLLGQRETRGAEALDNAETAKDDVWQVSVSAKTKPYGQDGPEVISANAGTAEVTIGNTVPVAVPVSGLVVQAGGEILIPLAGVDPDVDQGIDNLTFAITANPANGIVTNLDPVAGTLLYEPGLESSGPDSFEFSVDDDGELPVQEATVSVFVYSQWLVTMAVAGGVPAILQFGVTDGATAAFDSISDVPSDGEDTVGFLVAGGRQRRDVLGLPDEPVWEFEVTTDGNPVMLTWDPGAIPDRGLALCELDEPGGACIPGTMLDMVDTTELIVDATRGSTTRVFRIQAMAAVELPLERGWNLISLPLKPVDPSVKAVFGDRNVVPAEGNRTAVHSHAVYSWDPVAGQYDSVAEVEPLVGYWVYLDTAADLVVRGLPLAAEAIPLTTGWNLVGVAEALLLKEDEDLYSPVWVWNALGQLYVALQVNDTADPGVAFWAYVFGETELGDE